jgi:transmembrane sensor
LSTLDARHTRIEQEAADWLAALDTGQADLAAFEEWRARDTAHAVAFIRVEQAWRRLDRLAEAHVAVATVPGSVVHPPQPVLPRRRALVAAAGAAVAVAGGGLVMTARAAAHTVETAVGERRRFYIADRTCLDLNTASRLRWWKTGDGTEVSLLRGEVSLDLSAGAQPCTLDVGRARLRIEQGHFIARLRGEDAIDVVAIAGHVRLLPLRGQSRAASFPERVKLVVTADAATAHPISDAEIQALSAWQEGELLFDGEPLATAIEEFNRYLPTPMTLETPEIGRVRLGGRFLTNDPAEFLKALRVNFGIRAQSRAGKILLFR